MDSNEVAASHRAGDGWARDLARIAGSAGSAVLSAAGRAPRWKGGSPVTGADLAAERAIGGRLSEQFPGLPIVSEERIAAGDIPATGPRFALVAPGTAHRAPALGRRDVEVRDVHRPLQLEDASVAAKHRGDVRAQAVDRSTGLPFGLSNAPPSVRRCRLHGAAIARAALTCLLACTHDQCREG
ncbi:hypothetical protein [Methylobacterium sp. Leaf111]|uniref:hypothetical protein n=1 Tax=Methylobacterium sp. Leaf111 TaxID=1736257 RepID=UPI000A83BA14|nr:hypothetical protein [Methylobacterium sp. Leaf111]